MTQTIDEAARSTFKHLWNDGHDGKDLALAFVRIAAEVVREEEPADVAELRKLLD